MNTIDALRLNFAKAVQNNYKHQLEQKKFQEEAVKNS